MGEVDDESVGETVFGRMEEVTLEHGRAEKLECGEVKMGSVRR
jgi:hypothetical protein